MALKKPCIFCYSAIFLAGSSWPIFSGFWPIIFDNDKELEDDTEEEKAKSEMLDMMYTYMKDKLSPDAYLLFEVLITPLALSTGHRLAENHADAHFSVAGQEFSFVIAE